MIRVDEVVPLIRAAALTGVGTRPRETPRKEVIFLSGRPPDLRSSGESAQCRWFEQEPRLFSSRRSAARLPVQRKNFRPEALSVSTRQTYPRSPRTTFPKAPYRFSNPDGNGVALCCWARICFDIHKSRAWMDHRRAETVLLRQPLPQG